MFLLLSLITKMHKLKHLHCNISRARGTNFLKLRATSCAPISAKGY